MKAKTKSFERFTELTGMPPPTPGERKVSGASNVSAGRGLQVPIPGGRGNPSMQMPSAAQMGREPFGDVVTEIIHIPDSTCGGIIGRAGEQIAQFKQMSQVHDIQVAKQHMSLGGKRPVTIIGPRARVEEAMKMILVRVDELLRGPATAPSAVGIPYQSPSGSSMMMSTGLMFAGAHASSTGSNAAPLGMRTGFM